MIYIDPPYNTNTSKSYNDKKAEDLWLHFMKERLQVSKNFLRSDGVIFISIDDNEYAALKLLCDSIFGRKNYVGTFITMQAQRSNAKLINIVHEYILCYGKNKSKVNNFRIKRIHKPEDKQIIDRVNFQIKNCINKYGLNDARNKLPHILKEICSEYNISWIRNYSNIDDNGKIYFSVDLSTPSKPREVNIPEINLHLLPLKTRGWVSDERFKELHKQGRLSFKGSRPYEIHYLEDSEDNASSLLKFFSRQGTEDLKKIGLQGLFDTPKPVELLKYLVRISTDIDDAVLDFFAGSGSLAQAIWEVNKESGRDNKFVLIQLNEELNQKSEPYKKCLELSIEPNMENIIDYRLKSFLIANNMNQHYKIIKTYKNERQ